MATHTEIELKWALDAAGHHRLGEQLPVRLGAGRTIPQENRFFDAADLRLRRAGLNVRLRREGERVLLTCKRRLPDLEGAHRHEEWERWLEPELWAGLDQPGLEGRLPLPSHLRACLAGSPLTALGGFSNLRQEFSHGQELVCLDRTAFRGRTDFELEIETATPQATSDHWGQALRAWGVDFRPQPLSKFARFLALA